MEGSTDVCVTNRDSVNILAEHNQDVSPSKSATRFAENSSDDDEVPIQRIKKRLQHFSDSDGEKENISSHSDESETEDELVTIKSGLTKSRIQLGGGSSDSDLPEESELKNEQQIRLNNKRIKMKQKFHGLLSSRSKSTPRQSNSDVQSSHYNENTNSEGSDNDMSSIAKIKQKIKKSMATLPSICDPDTSDEESNTSTKIAPKQKPKKTQKAAKMIDAQPMRMSAKQAMENMQLIKSESNRMLREKAVSLPYHRPKAFTLKDIMSRRKPAVSSDGKVLPIKMNEEQLKHYAFQLEQRQKEMMELCKSESDEETVEKCEELDNIIPEHNIENSEEIVSNIPESKTPAPANKMAHLINPKKGDVAKIDNNTNGEITGENTACVHSDNIESITIDEAVIKFATNEDQSKNGSINSKNNQNDSNTDMRLVYNDDSIKEKNSVLNNDEVTTNGSEIYDQANKSEENVPAEKNIPKECSEQSSQSIHLNYTETCSEKLPETNSLESEELVKNQKDVKEMAFLSDDDLEMADIDLLIENAEILKDNVDDASISKLNNTLQIKPRLMGAPGMVIDLDGTRTMMQKRSGVELLKEKFTYFSKLKTPEEMEREKEKRLKPGAQHLKLRQELEEKIAEQRSLEWAKRLEEEKQTNQELNDILDDAEDADDSIDKIKSKLNEDDRKEESDSESEEELVEDDIDIKDKPRKHNPMVDNEAEESDIDEGEQETDLQEIDGNVDDVADEEESVADDNEESSDDEESSESEEEKETAKVRKGRILKAFEDSDNEDTSKDKDVEEIGIQDDNKTKEDVDCLETNYVQTNCEVPGSSEDDVIQLAQRPISVSEDLFTSQEYSAPTDDNNDANEICGQGTQSFSISSAKPNDFLCPSQPYHDPNLKEIADGFSQNMMGSQQSSQSQPIGEEILALCTGKFYENEFVSLNQESNDFVSQNTNVVNNINQNDKTEDVNDINIDNNDAHVDVSNNPNVINNKPIDSNHSKPEKSTEKNNDGNLLKSILDEMDDPDFDKPKENKYFTGGQNKINLLENTQMKKRLIIDSDDEVDNSKVDIGKKKKLKKKKLEDRALQFSDDEEEDEEDLEVEEEYESDIEDDSEKLIEYDSEENEIVVKPDEPKKKRKATDFFEQEAELTSEDEWVGSGDEDEKGLDRMEREEGDDDVFHQGKLRKELGQIHMRDVLDQDKREVRLLQELLFEDGDLGGGHRQRKFRWKNTEDEEADTVPDEFADTQEEEFESEEQWRKQRHEREVFLRQMKNQNEDETKVNVTVNRTTIIKANLSSKSMSSLLIEANQSKMENTDDNVAEKKPIKDLPSPKKMFSILKQNYHGSLLTRGRGALARLAALATPLAVDDDAPKIGSLAPHKRNFVFAALTPDDNPPKVSIKRKAEVSTPRLVKKMRTEEKQSRLKSSLLDHLNL